MTVALRANAFPCLLRSRTTVNKLLGHFWARSSSFMIDCQPVNY